MRQASALDMSNDEKAMPPSPAHRQPARLLRVSLSLESLHPMKRFIITVLVLTVLHAVACIIAPPFEFGRNRTECFFFALGGGLSAFSLITALVLWPLQRGLRRVLPPHMRRAQAVLAGLVLLALVAAWVFTRPNILPHQHGFYVYWLAWSIFAVAAAIAFFWPFGMDDRSSRMTD